MKGFEVTHHTGKGADHEVLPNRHALNTLAKGDPSRRTMNDYAKRGASIVHTGPSITDSEQK